MIIRNKVALGKSLIRRQALALIEAGIRGVLPHAVMKSALHYDENGNKIRVFDDEFKFEGRLFVIGFGKASGLMAKSLEDIVGPESITAGVVTCKKSDYGTKRIKVIAAGHPIPDRRSIRGAKMMLAMKDVFSINQNDLIVCLVSGGGSALLSYPVETIGLADQQAVNKLLIASGASINEINIVRKHMSEVKGGNLGRYFAPARIVSLILSDVVGNDLNAIASGPTVADPSTFQDALNILTRYGLSRSMPESVANYLAKGCIGEAPETPKLLDNCRAYIIGDNRLALQAIYEEAVTMGYSPCILTSEQMGDTTRVARTRANEIIRSGRSGEVFLIGGETTVKLPRNAGRGGRNQHYAAESITFMREYPGEWLVASVGTDGTDFMPGIGGAIVDNHSWDELRQKGLDIKRYLTRYDSNNLFNEMGDSLLFMGDTGTNVGDIMLYLLK